MVTTQHWYQQRSSWIGWGGRRVFWIGFDRYGSSTTDSYRVWWVLGHHITPELFGCISGGFKAQFCHNQDPCILGWLFVFSFSSVSFGKTDILSTAAESFQKFILFFNGFEYFLTLHSSMNVRSLLILKSSHGIKVTRIVVEVFSNS